MIIILGPDDIHTQRVQRRIAARGGHCHLLTTDAYPQSLSISSSLHRASHLHLPDGERVATESIRSVYWYAHSGLAYRSNYNPVEAESSFGSFLRNLQLRSDCLWINPLEAIQQHQYKFHQLVLLHQAGIRVPDTLACNYPDDLLAFYEKHNGKVICKPFYQGNILHQVRKEDLQPDKLTMLRHSPTLFQEYIEGQDIRVHIIGEHAFASAVISEQFNYKSAFRAEATELPDDVIKTCFKVAQTLGLILAGVDLRRTTAGEYVVFEANPSPQYLTFEDQWHSERCDFPITEALVDCLLHGKSN